MNCFQITFSITLRYKANIHTFNSIWLFCLILFIPLHGFTKESNTSAKHNRVTVYFENDFIVGKDEQYTNGFKLTWSRYGLSKLPEDAWLHKWLYPVIKFVNFCGEYESEKILTFSVGQNIFTPENLDTSELVVNDRPYAGVTYMQIGFHKKTNHHMHSLGFCAGIVGPHSYAEKIQVKIHEILSVSKPNGWDNQLKDEPVIGFVYDYKNKLIASCINSGFGGDIIFNTGGSIGNAATFYKIGLLIRYGWNVPNDYGNFPIQSATCFNAELEEAKPHMRHGIHLFFSVNSKAVFRDIFLDGNTFRDSHSVEKKPTVNTFSGGIGIITGRIKTVLAYIHQTKSFECQKSPQRFGSVNISYSY